MTYPLRLIVPIGLVLVGLVVAAWDAYTSLGDANRRTELVVSDLVSVLGSTAAAGVLSGIRNDDETRIRSSIEHLQLVRGMDQAILVRADGTIVQSSRAQDLDIGLETIGSPPVLEVFQVALRSRLVEKSVTGEHLYYGHFLEGALPVVTEDVPPDHVLILSYDFGNLHARNRSMAINQALEVSAVIFVFGLLSWLGLRRWFLWPMEGLVRASARIGDGDLDTPVQPFGANEVELLGQALDRMRVDLAASTRAVRESMATLDATEDGAFIFDPDSLLFTYVNEGAVQQLGYSRERLLTMTPVDIKPEFDETRLRALTAPLQSSSGGESVRFTTLHRRADGRDIPVEINLQHVPFPDGEGKFIAIVRDVTERVKAEDTIRQSLHEKETLLKEIHHRVKNNLQIVSSLLDMQMSNVADPAVKRVLLESVERVRSMSMIHEELYQSSTLAKIDFGEYVERLTHALYRSYATTGHVELVVETVTVEVNIETAVPCALILNELISNAFKHAYSEDEDGRLLVKLEREDDGLALTVQDSGPGLPPDFDAVRSRSLGFQLVETLTYQLKADLDISYDGGTRFQLVFRELGQPVMEAVHG